MPGDFGKPRPALIVQSDLFDQTGTVTVLLVTSMPIDAPLLRIPIDPTPRNNLRQPSQIMVDKAMSVRRERVGATIGKIDDDAMMAVTRSLAVFLGLA